MRIMTSLKSGQRTSFLVDNQDYIFYDTRKASILILKVVLTFLERMKLIAAVSHVYKTRKRLDININK